MRSVYVIIISAIIAFISTNLDNIVILTLFFTQTDKVGEKRNIVFGQYIGIIVLTIFSILGALGLALIPSVDVGFLGLVPIILGFQAIRKHLIQKEACKKKENDGELFSDSSEKSSRDETAFRDSVITFLEKYFNPIVVKVSLVTIADGGDNIGIYIPYFTGMAIDEIGIVFGIFMVLTGLWCLLAMKLAKYPLIEMTIEKYEHILVPLVFIGSGLFIMFKNGTLEFVFSILMSLVQ